MQSKNLLINTNKWFINAKSKWYLANLTDNNYSISEPIGITRVKDISGLATFKLRKLNPPNHFNL